MILAPTWKAYFASRESNHRGNQAPAAYLTAWHDASATPKAKLHLLTNDPDNAILAGDIGQGIMVLHSFKNFGGTILSPLDKFACLLGGTRMAPIIVVNEDAISDNIELTTPSSEDILACADVEELLNLDAPLAEENADTITFRGGNTFLPPPWLLDTVLDARTDNPYELILAAKAGAARFNEQQLAANPTYIPNTDITINEFVMWAWAVKKDLIPHTGYFFDPNDTDLENYQTHRHHQCILSLPPQPPAMAGAGGMPPNFNVPLAAVQPGATHFAPPAAPTRRKHTSTTCRRNH